MSDPPDESDERTSWTDFVEESAAEDGPGTAPPEADPVASPRDPLAEAPPAPARPDEAAEPVVVETGQEPPPSDDSVLSDVLAYVEDVDERFAPAPSESFVREEFFDFGFPTGLSEVDRYWLHEPYAYASGTVRRTGETVRVNKNELPATTEVTLTVTDDAGATDSSTRTIG